MRAANRLDPDVRADLEAVYEQVMWLARWPNVTAGKARAWYTHIMAERVKRRIRWFSGKVSRAAAQSESAVLRLEHYKRIQTALTSLVQRHRKLKQPHPEEFMRVVLHCERVHIVTFEENYSVMRANGHYRKAGIELVSWRSLPPKRQHVLWKKMLRGKGANADAYTPVSEKRA